MQQLLDRLFFLSYIKTLPILCRCFCCFFLQSFATTIRSVHRQKSLSLFLLCFLLSVSQPACQCILCKLSWKKNNSLVSISLWFSILLYCRLLKRECLTACLTKVNLHRHFSWTIDIVFCFVFFFPRLVSKNKTTKQKHRRWTNVVCCKCKQQTCISFAAPAVVAAVFL